MRKLSPFSTKTLHILHYSFLSKLSILNADYHILGKWSVFKDNILQVSALSTKKSRMFTTIYHFLQKYFRQTLHFLQKNPLSCEIFNISSKIIIVNKNARYCRKQTVRGNIQFLRKIYKIPISFYTNEELAFFY